MSLDLPGVTVCVTYHDEPHELWERAVHSVYAQTQNCHELIVIDDGSDTPVDLPSWCDKWARVVRVTNRGLPAARNTGLMLCRTEAILFIDSDDWIDEHYIEKTYPLLKAGADVVLTGLQEHGPTRNGTYFPGYNKPFDLVTLADILQMNLFYYCSLFRSATLREVGGYNPLMAGPWGKRGGIEDWDLTIDLMTRGAEYACVMEVLFHYSTSNTQSMAHTMDRAALEAEMKRHHRRQ